MICSSLYLVRFIVRPFVGSDSNSKWRKNPVAGQDEEGIPIQVSEKFHKEGDTKVSLKQRLVALCQTEDARLTSFEAKLTHLGGL